MSTMIARRHRIQLTIAAGALVFALVGGIASAFAQAAGGGRGGGGNSGGAAGAPDQNAVLVYGQPGNCPPTVGCGSRVPERPRVVRGKIVDPCGDHRPGSRLYHQCRADL